MLLLAAFLTLGVSLMHSVLGDRHLIQPILRMEGLPVIHGSVTNTRRTLWLAWHVTSLTWLGIAAMLAYLNFARGSTATVFLWIVAVMFAISGTVAPVASRGAHRSWMFFFPIAAISAFEACVRM